MALIGQHQGAFSWNRLGLGQCDAVQHPIPTNSDRPAHRRTHRIPYVLGEQTEKQEDEMLENGIIGPSISPWGALTLAVQKPDGSCSLE